MWKAKDVLYGLELALLHISVDMAMQCVDVLGSYIYKPLPLVKPHSLVQVCSSEKASCCIRFFIPYLVLPPLSFQSPNLTALFLIASQVLQVVKNNLLHRFT